MTAFLVNSVMDTRMKSTGGFPESRGFRVWLQWLGRVKIFGLKHIIKVMIVCWGKVARLFIPIFCRLGGNEVLSTDKSIA